MMWITASPSSVLNICGGDIFNEVRLAGGAGEPQVPRDNESLDGVSKPARIRHSAHDVLRLLKRIVDSLSSQLFIRFKCFLHGVRLAFLHPAGETTGEEDGVFEDNPGALALGWHCVLPIMSAIEPSSL